MVCHMVGALLPTPTIAAPQRLLQCFSFFRYKACHEQAPILGGTAGPQDLEHLKLEPLLHQTKYLVLQDLAVRFYRTENSDLAGSQRSHIQNSYPRENGNFGFTGPPSSSKGKHVTQKRPTQEALSCDAQHQVYF